MKNLLLLVGLCLSISVYAQKERKGAKLLPSNVGIEKSTVLKMKNRRTSFQDIISQDSSGFYGYSAKFNFFDGAETYLNHFNSNLDLDKQTTITFKFKDKELELIKFESLKGELYAFLSFYNEKDDKFYFFTQSINKNTLELNNDLKKVAEMDATGRKNAGEINLAVSKDESKVLLYSKMFKSRKESKEEGETFNLTVLDNHSNFLWSKLIVLPYTDKLYSNKGVKVDNDGNVFLLGTLYKDKVKEKNRDGNPNYDEIISFYTDNGAKEDEFRIDLKDKFITDLSIMPTNRGEVICTGLYADKIKARTPIKGVFFLRANAFTKTIETENYKDFSQEVLDQFSIGASFGKKKGLFEFDLRDIILRSDGGAVLLAEQFYIKKVTTTNSKGGSSTTYLYNYNNIIAININPNGSIDWITNVPKLQVSANDGGRYSSFAQMVANGKIYLMYNDNAKNIATKQGKFKTVNTASKSQLLMLVEINPDGTWNKYPLYNNRDNGTISRPKMAKQVGKNQIIIEGDRRKNYNFLRVTVK